MMHEGERRQCTSTQNDMGVDECVGQCEVGECTTRWQATHTKIGATNWEYIGCVRCGNVRHDKVWWEGWDMIREM